MLQNLVLENCTKSKYTAYYQELQALLHGDKQWCCVQMSMLTAKTRRAYIIAGLKYASSDVIDCTANGIQSRLLLLDDKPQIPNRHRLLVV
jgi:hypothetical protein